MVFLVCFAGSLTAFAGKVLEGELTFVRDGQIVKLELALAEAVIGDVLAFVDYTGYDATSYNGNKKKWDWALKEGTYFYVKYPEPTKIKVCCRQEIVATEILIPCYQQDEQHDREGCQILVRHNDQFWSYTKAIYQQYYNLLCRPELALKTYIMCREYKRFDSPDDHLLDQNDSSEGNR